MTEQTNNNTFGQKLDPYGYALLAGAALAVIGSFMPWASALGISVNGFSGDGIITAIIGAIMLGLTFFLYDRRKSQRRLLVVLAVLAALIALIGIYDGVNLQSGSPVVSLGIGIYLVIIGGLVAAGGPVVVLFKRSRHGVESA